MSETKVGKFTFSSKLVNQLEKLIIDKQLNKLINKLTIDDCFLLFKEKNTMNIEKVNNDSEELLQLWLELYQKYGVSCDINEVNECITSTVNVIENIWLKHSWNFTSYTLEYFLGSIVEVEYTTILSFTHLILLVNYYMYDDRQNYYEKHYVGDDKTGIYFKSVWDDIEDEMHSCEICEHICANTKCNNDYIILSEQEKH
jgi:hypothetical protein